MGNRISKLLKRLFDYPIKRKPICFFRSEDFTTTGEPISKDVEQERSQLTEYDKLVQSFYTRLDQERQSDLKTVEKDVRTSFEKIAEQYPGWDDVTVSNLHNLFLLFDNNMNGMLDYEDFASILECLGDTHTYEERKEKFTSADTDLNGWITYDEYLSVIFNFDPPDQYGLTGLAKLAVLKAENVHFVTQLSVGEQLEYGLF
ncbi:uncharacterized protein LOC108734936 [Agrilus planipennis]|uniref:Uncharacterized protein LOC108734936 n=1 Tax=Agrilus planipennis TaxID=224129 RepID=A0A1W4WE18_AGRPL|nr:uncharacterized protein LOC108734936 [Agrilus planipennis]